MDFRCFESDTPLTRTVRGYLSLEPFSTAVKPPKYPERGRGFTVKPLPSFLEPTERPAPPDTVYNGFGCAARASRNTFTFLLSTTTVPVSTHVGMAAAGAAPPSFVSC